MDGAQMLDADPALAAIVRRVVELYQPERVYLFGSKARGDDGPDSDYDLLVVVPDDADDERRDSARYYRVGAGVPCPADVLIWRRERFDAQAQRVVASLPATVMREGKLLYAA